MPIEIQCANTQCGQGMAAPDELAGQQVACPACGFINSVPAKPVYAQAVRIQPAQATADKVRSRRGRSQSKSKALPIMLFMLCACGGAGYWYMTQNPASPKPAKNAAAPKPKPKAGPTMQDQLYLELQELDLYAKKNKRDYANVIPKYEAFLKKNPNELLAKRARQKIEKMKDHLDTEGQSEFFRRKKETDELLKDWKLIQAAAIWKNFPSEHKSKVQDLIDGQLGIIGRKANEYSAHQKTRIEGLLSKSPFELTAEDKEDLHRTLKSAEEVRDKFRGSFLEPSQALNLAALVKAIEQKLDSSQVVADPQQAHKSLKEMWGSFSKLVKEKKFDDAVNQLEEQQLSLGPVLYKQLKKDVLLIQSAFETAYGRIDRLVEKTAKINGRLVKISEVRDGKLYYKGKEIERVYEPTSLDLSEIIKLCREENQTDETLYRETLFSIYYGSVAAARNAIEKSRKSGFTWQLYEWRVIPLILVKTTPSGASVAIKPGKSGTRMRTPMRMEAESRTTYTIEISKRGHFSQTKKVKTKTGEETLVEVKLEKTFLPKWMEKDFDVPLEPNDIYGNPVNRGLGHNLDYPKEIRSKKSGTYLVLVPHAPIFYLGKYEITIREWACYVGKSGARTLAETKGYSKVYDGKTWVESKGANWRRPRVEQNTSNHPVLHLGSRDIKNYANWIKTQKGHFRMPIHYEWEFAGQGGTGAQRYYWEGGQKEAGRHGNVADATLKRSLSSFRNADVFETNDHAVFTREVGKYSPNGYGLYDMIGNVWEKCRTLVDKKYYSNFARGGAWDTGPSLATIIPLKKSYIYMDGFYRSDTNDTTGGRLLFDLKDPEPELAE
jgi:hypothetical protein